MVPLIWESQRESRSRRVGISCIAVAKHRLRALREDTADALTQSMADQGQLQPIVVRPRKDGGYWLVAGLHRLAAAKKLKWKEINCTIFDGMAADEAELAEIDENLIRAELSPAERALHIGKRKELYENAHPETRKGGAPVRAGGGKKAKTAKLVTFARDTATKTRVSRRSVERDATRAKQVVVLSEIAQTSIDKGAEIDALAKLPESEQRKLAEAARRGDKISAIAARSAFDVHDQKISDGTGKVPSRARQHKKADRAPRLDSRAWSISTPQEREAFVKAVGRRDIDDIIKAIEPRGGFDTLKQAWNAATPYEQHMFATEYYDVISTKGRTKKY
jgi:ParB-like chromosome segregation protein Spo0J